MAVLPRFVAEFMGIANILMNHLPGGGWDNMKRGCLMFRPEDVEICEGGNFEGTVLWYETIGSVKRVTIDFLGDRIIAEIRNYYKSGINCAIGDKIRFAIDMKGAHVIRQ